jgi:hypothetical protein
MPPHIFYLLSFFFVHNSLHSVYEENGASVSKTTFEIGQGYRMFDK